MSATNLTIPLEGFLTRDLPEIASWAPGQWRAAACLHQLRTHAVSAIVVTLEVAVAWAFTGADCDVRRASGSRNHERRNLKA